MPVEAHREGPGIAPNHLQPGARRRCVVSTTLRTLCSRKRASTNCTGGWVGLGAGLDVTENLDPHRDSIPGPSSPVAGNLLGNEVRPPILSNSSVQYRSHKSLSEAHLLRHINAVHLLMSNFCNIRFNVIVPYTLISSH